MIYHTPNTTKDFYFGEKGLREYESLFTAGGNKLIIPELQIYMDGNGMLYYQLNGQEKAHIAEFEGVGYGGGSTNITLDEEKIMNAIGGWKTSDKALALDVPESERDAEVFKKALLDIYFTKTELRKSLITQIGNKNLILTSTIQNEHFRSDFSNIDAIVFNQSHEKFIRACRDDVRKYLIAGSTEINKGVHSEDVQKILKNAEMFSMTIEEFIIFMGDREWLQKKPSYVKKVNYVHTIVPEVIDTFNVKHAVLTDGEHGAYSYTNEGVDAIVVSDRKKILTILQDADIHSLGGKSLEDVSKMHAYTGCGDSVSGTVIALKELGIAPDNPKQQVTFAMDIATIISMIRDSNLHTIQPEVIQALFKNEFNK